MGTAFEPRIVGTQPAIQNRRYLYMQQENPTEQNPTTPDTTTNAPTAPQEPVADRTQQSNGPADGGSDPVDAPESDRVSDTA